MYVEIEYKLNKDKVLAKNPTLEGRFDGYDFYECPIHGDERPLIAIGPNGCGYTPHYELPVMQDFI